MWLLLQEILLKIETARLQGLGSEAQRVQFNAVFGSTPSGQSRIMALDGDTATINISGVLTDAPDFFAWLFGGGNTTYSEIIAAIAQADNSSDIEIIKLRINSPGGSASAGWLEVMKTIAESSTKIEAIGIDSVFSAAYGLASQTDKITGLNVMTKFGSVGAVATFTIDKDTIKITSDNAEGKVLDAESPEGVARIKSHVNTIHDVFVDRIVTGRGTTKEKIDADFGKGDFLFAEKALQVGMIDEIQDADMDPVNINQTADENGGDNMEANKMDLEKLKAEHPDLFAKIKGLGISAENDRIMAHLTYGAANPESMKIAMKAIEDKTELTALVIAKYNTASANAATIDATTEEMETVETDTIDPVVKSKEATFDAAVEKALGVEVEEPKGAK